MLITLGQTNQTRTDWQPAQQSSLIEPSYPHSPSTSITQTQFRRSSYNGGSYNLSRHQIIAHFVKAYLLIELRNAGNRCISKQNMTKLWRHWLLDRFCRSRIAVASQSHRGRNCEQRCTSMTRKSGLSVARMRGIDFRFYLIHPYARPSLSICPPATRWYCAKTSSSAIAEGPRDALRQLKSCQLLHNCTKNHIW